MLREDKEDYDMTAKTEGKMRENDLFDSCGIMRTLNIRVLAIGGAELSLEQMSKAQKYIKWAGSALNYDDVSTAVSNLQKALHLLTTGQELA